MSAFTEVVYISYTGKFKTLSETTGQMGVLKTFYPGGEGSLFHLLPLTAIPAVVLSGSERENIDERITNIHDGNHVPTVIDMPVLGDNIL